jgi:hypothetical protein
LSRQKNTYCAKNDATAAAKEIVMREKLVATRDVLIVLVMLLAFRAMTILRHLNY